MKVIVGDKVIAKPVIFYFGPIPLAVLPFAFFPTKTGRRSGLIIPRFGQSALEGRFIRDLGYYWAISDYLDARASVDFFDRSGWFMRGGVNYAKRYQYSGNIGGSLTRKNFALTDQRDRFWDLRIAHNHTINENTSLRASGNFVSNNSFYDLSDNRNQQLTRRLESRATYSQRFGGGSNNLSVNLSESKDLEDGSFQRVLPQISLNFSRKQLFKYNKPSTTRADKKDEPRWYNNIYYNFSSRADYRLSKGAGSNATTEKRSQASHVMSLSLSTPKSIVSWLNLNQSLRINEDWFDRVTNFDTSGTSITSEEEKGFAARHTFNYSLSANTKFYGLFQPGIGPILALRHVATPNLSFSYRPDFSDPFWGYFEELTLADGTTERRDRFGGTGSGKTASLNFSLSNLFQMKTGSEEKPKKTDLFSLNFSSGYNFAADSLNLANLNTSFQANPARNFSVSMRSTHNFYDFDNTTGNRRARFLLTSRDQFFRLTSFRVDASLRLEGKGGTEKASPVGLKDANNTYQPDYGLEQQDLTDRFAPTQRFSDTSVPWKADFAFSYSLSRSNPLSTTRRAQLSLRNAEIRLTNNWRVGVSGQLDLIDKSIVDQRYTIYRDLHCWEMQVFWTPSGVREGFYLRINIKAPHLKDIKVEKRGGRASVFGGAY